VSSLRARLGDERGATLALVAMMLTAMLTLTALVVDIGGGWGVRQRLIPATDSAALAAAQDLVHWPSDTIGACNRASAYIAGNAQDATMTGCDVTHFPSGGKVTVAAAETATGTFASFGGSNQQAIDASSSAEWGAPTTVSGLRPVGLCYDGWPDLRTLIDHPPSAPTAVVVPFLKDDPAACGSGSTGNFLSVDFEHDTGISTLKDWTRFGHPGQVGFGPPTTNGCDNPVPCAERPYAIPSINGALASLVYSGDYVPFPVYDFADSDEVHLVGFVRARLLDFHFDPYQPLSSWWLELKVEPGLVAGTCCEPTGFTSGNQVVALCGVDPDAQPACGPTTTP
jgi:Flp pilus assembly protein TadG